MTSKLPTDPLADASTGVVRRSRGAFSKTTPAGKPERRRPSKKQYTGPERRKAEPAAPAATAAAAGTPVEIFGFPRWMVIVAGVYLAALVLAMVLIFTY